MVACHVFLRYALHQKSTFATSKCLLQAENSLTGRAYIGEVLMQIWLKFMKK